MMVISLFNPVTTMLNGSFRGSITDMVASSGPVAKVVLFILLIFSIVSWAIIILKFRLFWQINREAEQFLDIVRKKDRDKDSLASIHSSIKRFKNNPFSSVFVSCYRELSLLPNNLLDKQAQQIKATGTSSASDTDKSSLITSEWISNRINRAASEEILKIEKLLPFLATTGSITPFIGLFGTVWGVMDAFRMIGVKGTASIGGVAPGISEALIATAAGLAVAIPAVIAYNYFTNKTRVITARLEDFSVELKLLVQRALENINVMKN